MFLKILEQIAKERIAEVLAGMSQLGVSEQVVYHLLEKRQGEVNQNVTKK